MCGSRNYRRLLAAATLLLAVALASGSHRQHRQHRSLASSTCERSRWEDVLNRDLDLLRTTHVYPLHLDMGR
jgi:hypothetical protein